MAMQYSGPITQYVQAIADQSRPWIPASTLAQALRNLKNISPSTQAGRQQIIDTVATLQAGQPYAIKDGFSQTADLRFSTIANAGVANPAIVYVATFSDGWAQVFNQLQLAADFSQRFNEKGVVSPADSVANMPNSDSMQSQKNDAGVSVRKAVLTADRLMSNCTGLYNYHTFETKYQLIWSTATEGLSTRTTSTVTDSVAPISLCANSSPVNTHPSIPAATCEAVLRGISKITDLSLRTQTLELYFQAAVDCGLIAYWTKLMDDIPLAVVSKARSDSKVSTSVQPT
jgi:hypothetical protein